MTPQESYEHHRGRAFRDPDGPAPKGVDWEDPLEVVAIVNYAMTYGAPPEVWSDVGSPKGRERLNGAWAGLAAHTRALLRGRAAVSMMADGSVRGA